MRRADRSVRVLLKSPRLKDRAFVRETGPETRSFFKRLDLAGSEKAFLQSYHPEKGWQTIDSKGKSKVA